MSIRYVIPKGKGIQRHRHGKTFRYTLPDGRPLRDSATLERIRALVIPPAWESVWISPSADSHIQAVGRDARGRKQYRYHAEFRKVRDMVKFDRMRDFGKMLPKIRRAVGRDLNKPGISKHKIVAAVVRLLETTYIRIGNEEYAEENGSFGLTTFRNRHVTILGEVLKFRFRGKSGQKHDIQLKDKRLARILRRCKDIPGSALFQYLDADGNPQSIHSDDVNDYIRTVTGGEFTAKDFRTWGGTCLAADYFMSKCQDMAPTKSAVVEVVKNVAEKLGNRPATCRKYYIHPTVMDCYMSGHLEKLAPKFEQTRSIRDYEQIVLSLLKPLKKSLLREARQQG
jgi:DNA topoisomerase-1